MSCALLLLIATCCMVTETEANSLQLSWDHLYRCQGAIKERCQYLSLFCRSSILGRPAKRSDPSYDEAPMDNNGEIIDNDGQIMDSDGQLMDDDGNIINDDTTNDFLYGNFLDSDNSHDGGYRIRQRRDTRGNREKRFVLTCKHCAVYCWHVR